MKYLSYSGSVSGSVASGTKDVWQLMLTAGSATGTLTLYDNTTGSGTKLHPGLSAPANSTVIHDLTPVGGLRANTAIYASVTGGATYTIWFE